VGSNNRKHFRRLARIKIRVALLRYKLARISHSMHPKKGKQLRIGSWLAGMGLGIADVSRVSNVGTWEEIGFWR
jgi:hypothetical protein